MAISQPVLLIYLVYSNHSSVIPRSCVVEGGGWVRGARTLDDGKAQPGEAASVRIPPLGYALHHTYGNTQTTGTASPAASTTVQVPSRWTLANV